MEVKVTIESAKKMADVLQAGVPNMRRCVALELVSAMFNAKNWDTFSAKLKAPISITSSELIGEFKPFKLMVPAINDEGVESFVGVEITPALFKRFLKLAQSVRGDSIGELVPAAAWSTPYWNADISSTLAWVEINTFCLRGYREGDSEPTVSSESVELYALKSAIELKRDVPGFKWIDGMLYKHDDPRAFARKVQESSPAHLVSKPFDLYVSSMVLGTNLTSDYVRVTVTAELISRIQELSQELAAKGSTKVKTFQFQYEQMLWQNNEHFLMQFCTVEVSADSVIFKGHAKHINATAESDSVAIVDLFKAISVKTAGSDLGAVAWADGVLFASDEDLKDFALMVLECEDNLAVNESTIDSMY